MRADEVGSIAEVLIRHGFHPRWPLCPNPQHDDKRPGSVSILPASAKGPERIYCHSCQWNENNIGLARLLGDHVTFDSPSRSAPSFYLRRWKEKTSRRQRVTKVRLMKELEDDPTIEKDWILAKKLAELGNPRAVQVEIQCNWDYLSENYNLPRAYELCQRVWDYGVERLGLTGEFKYWVERVAAELEAS